MSKINHSRPQLRFIDNLRRELAHEASMNSFPRDSVRSRQHRETSDSGLRMPRLGSRAAKIAISLLNLLEGYYDNQSLLLKSISPQAAKGERKKAKLLELEKDSLEKQILEKSIELVMEALKRQSDGDSSISEWLDWLQSKAISTDSYALLDLFEIGIKPAFEALSKVVSQKVE